MVLLSAMDIKTLINKIGIKTFIQLAIVQLEIDLKQWHKFDKSPRHAIYSNKGVIELMPTACGDRYSVKYVNGHPDNPLQGKCSVIAAGLLSDNANGYPILFCDMTILTAIRTAVVTAIAAKHLARKGSCVLSIIGCGAQAEFQVLACAEVLDIKEVKYYDCDPYAMDKFAHNLCSENFIFTPGQNIAELLMGPDMIITATANCESQQLFSLADIPEGTHIHGLGGDSPGKTELDKDLLATCKIVVEYLPQCQIEGEIQQNLALPIHAELWELLSGDKRGRTDDKEITLFDAVGFAVEDFSILKLIEDLVCQKRGEPGNLHEIGQEVDFLPTLANPKDLFGFLKV